MVNRVILLNLDVDLPFHQTTVELDGVTVFVNSGRIKKQIKVSLQNDFPVEIVITCSPTFQEKSITTFLKTMVAWPASFMAIMAFPCLNCDYDCYIYKTDIVVNNSISDHEIRLSIAERASRINPADMNIFIHPELQHSRVETFVDIDAPFLNNFFAEKFLLYFSAMFVPMLILALLLLVSIIKGSIISIVFLSIMLLSAFSLLFYVASKIRVEKKRLLSEIKSLDIITKTDKEA